ncbi:hypothetical protein C8J56DRAFT_892017 [Mycena floridula]|nr:hypothetical protein C8J56DRAFT_892017 [Mycena floridula]
MYKVDQQQHSLFARTYFGPVLQIPQGRHEPTKDQRNFMLNLRRDDREIDRTQRDVQVLDLTTIISCLKKQQNRHTDNAHAARNAAKRNTAAKVYYQTTLKARRRKQREETVEQEEPGFSRPTLHELVAELEQDFTDWKLFGGSSDWTGLRDRVTAEEMAERDSTGVHLRSRLRRVFIDGDLNDVDRAELNSIYRRCLFLSTGLVHGGMILRGFH